MTKPWLLGGWKHSIKVHCSAWGTLPSMWHCRCAPGRIRSFTRSSGCSGTECVGWVLAPGAIGPAPKCAAAGTPSRPCFRAGQGKPMDSALPRSPASDTAGCIPDRDTLVAHHPPGHTVCTVRPWGRSRRSWGARPSGQLPPGAGRAAWPLTRCEWAPCLPYRCHTCVPHWHANAQRPAGATHFLLSLLAYAVLSLLYFCTSFPPLFLHTFPSFLSAGAGVHCGWRGGAQGREPQPGGGD